MNVLVVRLPIHQTTTYCFKLWMFLLSGCLSTKPLHIVLKCECSCCQAAYPPNHYILFYSVNVLVVRVPIHQTTTSGACPRGRCTHSHWHRFCSMDYSVLLASLLIPTSKCYFLCSSSFSFPSGIVFLR